MDKVRITSEFDRTADFILYEGDCLDLLSRIPDGFVKLVITSPPYNLGKPYETRLELDEYLDQQRMAIEECVRVLDDRGSVCWQVGNYVDNGEIVPLDIVLYPIFASLGLHLRNRIVWHFGHGLHASKRFSGRYEVVDANIDLGNATPYQRQRVHFQPGRCPCAPKIPKEEVLQGAEEGAAFGQPSGQESQRHLGDSQCESEPRGKDHPPLSVSGRTD